MSNGEKAALTIVILLVVIGIIVVLWSGLKSDGSPKWSKPESNGVVTDLDGAALKLGLATKTVFGPEQLDDMSSCLSTDPSTGQVRAKKGTCTMHFGSLPEDTKERRYVAVRKATCQNSGSLIVYWTPKLSESRVGRRDDSTDPDWKSHFGMPRFGGRLDLQISGPDATAQCRLESAPKGT